MLSLFYIFASELIEASSILLLPQIDKHNSLLFFSIISLMQFMSAPIQGGFSDTHCRRKSLIFALLAVIIGSICLYLSFFVSIYFLFFSIVIYAMFGNVDVIGRAALLDKYKTRNRTVLIGSSLIAQTLAWVFIATAIENIPNAYIILFTTFIGLVALSTAIFIFKDNRDISKIRYKFHIKSEFRAIRKFLKKKFFITGLASFALLEIVYYLLFLYEQISSSIKMFTVFTIFFSSGFVFGLILQMLTSKNEMKNIVIGTFISFLSLVGAILTINITRIKPTVGLFYFLFSMGMGICVASFYSLFSKRKGTYQEGKLFGILSSLQTLGIFIPTIIISYIKFDMLTIHLFTILLLCVVITVFSYFYKRKEDTF